MFRVVYEKTQDLRALLVDGFNKKFGCLFEDKYSIYEKLFISQLLVYVRNHIKTPHREKGALLYSSLKCDARFQI